MSPFPARGRAEIGATSAGRANSRGRAPAHRGPLQALRRTSDEPSTEERIRSNRRVRFGLREGLRTLQASTRARDCGHRPIGGSVDVVRGEGKRCGYSGLLGCDSVWGCFVCAGKILAQYAGDLNAVVEHHGFSKTLLGSFTTRHYADDELKWLRREQSKCFTELLAGKGWGLIKDRFGVVGVVRAIDVTYGEASGFHSHLHPLFFLSKPHEGRAAHRELADINARLFQRWCAIVRRRMGDRYVPNQDHGVLLKPCYRADYLVKMGVSLEVTGAFSKRAKNGNVSILEVAIRACEGDERAGNVFRRYTRDMKGAKFLTWSKGAKTLLEQAKPPEPEKEEADQDVVASIPNESWRLLRGIREVKVELLEAAEARGTEGVLERVTFYIGRDHATRAGPRAVVKTDRVLALDYTGTEAPCRMK